MMAFPDVNGTDHTLGRESMDNDRPYHPAPELQRVLDDLERLGNPLDQMARDNVADLWLQRETLATRVLAPLPLAGVRDAWVPARNRVIPVRIYTPADRGLARNGQLPALVYYHGGGWTLGSLATYDSLCRALARGSGGIVVSVDYRLAPEHPFPAAVEDAHLALEWVARPGGAHARRLAVGGDSAGGTLATVVARRARQEQIPLVYQALFYPSTDVSRTDGPSYQQYGRGYWLTTRAVETFRDFYLPVPSLWRHPDASPLLAPDKDLRLLPPALIMTAGCDVLRDEGRAYADRLEALGVPVVYRLEPELIHASLNLFNSPFYPDASRRVEPVVESLARAIRTGWKA
jgi:acetyl esterase